jgi:hypothetical protein
MTASPAVREKFEKTFRTPQGRVEVPNVETGLGTLRTLKEQAIQREQERQRAFEVVKPRGPSLSGPSR